MNHKLLTSAFCLMCLLSYAQVNTQSYISLNLGPSIPLGDYGKADLDNDESGFAKFGPNISVEGTYFFMDYIGIGGQVGFNMHFFNKRGVREELNKEKEVDYIDYYFSTPYFNIYGAMGLYFNLPVTERFHITPKILGGYLSTLSPEVDADVYYTDNTSDYVEADAQSGGTIALLFGVNFRYIITDHFMMKLNVEGATGKQEFQDFDGYLTGMESQITFLNINLSAGIAF